MEYFSGDGMILYYSFLVEAKSWTVAILIPAEFFYVLVQTQTLKIAQDVTQKWAKKPLVIVLAILDFLLMKPGNH